MAKFDRIRWRCRRGLLELDLILKRFLERRFDGLNERERWLFDELLDVPDNDLLDMALGRLEPEPRHQAVMEMLRAG